ncbi:MAG: hypothetical protein IKK26_00500 [Clostridia bacterium]|nr:hypothetical protein [Clostridia bacterium]
MADGTVIIDTLIDTKGFGKGVTNMRGQFNKLSGAVKKLGAAVGIAFGVAQIVQFSKAAIDLGSDLQEVQNVVNVTFGGMSKRVDEFAQTAIEQFGLSELSAKQYASTLGAIFKSSGFDIAEATAMSTALAGLAGDIASFYNLSGEEAFTKLRSGITGETEPLKQLGINLNVANLEAFALSQGITKAYDAMSQQEQMMLRYNYILNATSDAQGDFARTSQSWANQTRILTERFNSLKATIGQGLINALTPVIQVINTILIGLQKLANAFKQFTALLFGDAGGGAAASNAESVADSYGSAAESAEDMAAASKSAAKSAKILSGLDEVNIFNSGSGGGSGGTAGADVFADVNFGESLLASADADSVISGFASDLAEAIKTHNWRGVGELLASKLNGLFEGIDTSKIGGTVSNILTGTLDVAIGFFDELDGETIGNKIYDFAYGVITGVDWGGIVHKAIELAGAELDLLGEILIGFVEKPFSDFSEWFEETAYENGEFTAEGLLNGISEKLKDLDDWLEQNVFEPFDTSFLELFKLSGDSSGWARLIAKKIVEGMLEGLSNMPGKAGEIFGELHSIATGESSLMEIDLKGIWENIKTKAREKAQQIKSDFTQGFLDAKADAIQIWTDTKTKLTTLWENTKNTASRIWTNLVSVIKNPINSIIGAINGMISGVVSGINAVIRALNRLHITIPSWLPVSFAGKTFGFNISYLSAPQIPYLAKGAVIPPNAPFMAVLGDQRTGNNIEAPENLIRKIVREETSGNNGGTYKFTAQINRRVLFEEIIEEGKRSRDATGNNPFLLA